MHTICSNTKLYHLGPKHLLQAWKPLEHFSLGMRPFALIILIKLNRYSLEIFNSSWHQQIVVWVISGVHIWSFVYFLHRQCCKHFRDVTNKFQIKRTLQLPKERFYPKTKQTILLTPNLTTNGKLGLLFVKNWLELDYVMECWRWWMLACPSWDGQCRWWWEAWIKQAELWGSEFGVHPTMTHVSEWTCLVGDVNWVICSLEECLDVLRCAQVFLFFLFIEHD